jgi:hypothetical protein
MIGELLFTLMMFELLSLAEVLVRPKLTTLSAVETKLTLAPEPNVEHELITVSFASKLIVKKLKSVLSLYAPTTFAAV